jgi:hypothetical protein
VRRAFDPLLSVLVEMNAVVLTWEESPEVVQMGRRAGGYQFRAVHGIIEEHLSVAKGLRATAVTGLYQRRYDGLMQRFDNLLVRLRSVSGEAAK